MRVFWGPDEFGVREEIDRMAVDLKLAVQWVDKRVLADKPLGQWVDEGAGGLFGKSLVVAIDPAGWLKKDQDVLVEMITDDPKLLIVWQRGEFDKRLGWYKKGVGAKKIREFRDLAPAQLSQWMDDYILREGGEIESEARGELVARVGADRWRLKGEMDKLLVRGERVDVAMVKEDVPEAEGAGEVFAMLDAVAMGKSQDAMRRLTALLKSGESEFYVLSMMAYQLKTLLIVRSGQEAGQKEYEVAKTAGLHPYVVQKNWRAAERWRREQLVALLTRLLATDAAIKRGVVEARTGVTMMMVGMMR